MWRAIVSFYCRSYFDLGLAGLTFGTLGLVVVVFSLDGSSVDVLDDLHVIPIVAGLGLGGDLEELGGQALGAGGLDGAKDVGLEALVVGLARAGAGGLCHCDVTVVVVGCVGDSSVRSTGSELVFGGA